jgi:hypothetical protein
MVLLASHWDSRIEEIDRTLSESKSKFAREFGGRSRTLMG